MRNSAIVETKWTSHLVGNQISASPDDEENLALD